MARHSAVDLVLLLCILQADPSSYQSSPAVSRQSSIGLISGCSVDEVRHRLACARASMIPIEACVAEYSDDAQRPVLAHCSLDLANDKWSGARLKE